MKKIIKQLFCIHEWEYGCNCGDSYKFLCSTNHLCRVCNYSYKYCEKCNKIIGKYN